MKLTKAQNPHDVRVGQVWKAKDKRRKKTFTVLSVEEGIGIWFAVVGYGKGKAAYKTKIDLKNFNRYVKVK